MNVFAWLNGEAFTAFGQHVIWSDMLGNVIGLAALALGWRRSILTWPTQLFSGLILVGAFASAQLAGGVGKQVLVIVVALWGWRQWRRGHQQAQDGSIAVRFATWRERGLLALGTALGTVAVGWLFSLVPTLSWNPWPDAYIFVGTLAAMLAQARGLVEFWFAWLLVDVVGVPLAFSSGLPFSGFVYVVYLGLVLWGMRAWWQRSRVDEALARAARPGPALNGAAL
ncbi:MULTISPECIES: nicotinamide mononucleotide transporter family protein [unclassified Streptomyces]|uniref:nicotinamide mononucleotide transporter family protein n=1 Tax=unclassified Streptomyces TaxID=2593676 RepID=UPI002DD910AB|nr:MULTISPECIES: nicotinamide mononucleotide transporter family protein [unclassified Streptomyces]WSA96374.1 nicotinamide mononucleotide transporter family protein [Streptomyces sp. NBC_01795]WSB80788.1 nicotinamide mononucleotide transporter family protein [Streptomyces sp. NBC_01775]WSS11003.1 nicotinamide mononucleotide transporter family protein [Streptomyces sp. NBC_01186]WSS39709.1 nicotinamide mononucleotide transporter family protein [Streptomyces sp. NBC_01187]